MSPLSVQKSQQNHFQVQLGQHQSIQLTELYLSSDAFNSTASLFLPKISLVSPFQV